MFKTKKQIIVAASFILSVTLALLVYFILIATGAVNLLQRNLIFTSGSLSETYASNVTVECHEYKLESGDLYTGHYVEVNYLSKLDHIGSIDNEFVVIIYDSNDNVVTSKYDIELVPGTLTITGVPIKIKTADATKVYDGTELTEDSWTILSGGLLENHSLDVLVTGSRVNAGASDNDFVMTVFDEFDNDVTNLYLLEKELGVLEVSTRTISILTSADSKIYDGTELTNDGYYVITESNLIDGHNIIVRTTGTITEVGTTSNTIHWCVLDDTLNDVSSNYNVLLTAGNLEILKRPVSIVTYDLEKVYDGDALTADTYSISSLLPGHTEKTLNPSSITNVGSIENTFVVLIYDELDNDVTSYYEIDLTPGTLTITSYDLVIRTSSAEKTYDGDYIFSEDYELLGDMLAGHNLEIIDYTKFYEADSKANTIIFRVLNEEDVDVTSNFAFDKSTGTLTIFKKSIVIETQSFNFEYTGDSYLASNISNNVVNCTDIIENWYFRFNSDVAIVEVGTIQNIATIYIEDNAAINYDIKFNYGTITVYKQNIYIQTGSQNFEYDEKYYGYAYATITSSSYKGLPVSNYYSDSILSIDNFITVKELGTYYNTADIQLKDSANYSLTIVWGGITIWTEDKILIEIMPVNVTIGVDNTTHYVSDYLVNGKNLYGLSAYTSQGFSYTATIIGEISSIGYARTTITNFTLYNEYNDIVLSYAFGEYDSDEYRLKVSDGIIVMTDVTITVTSEAADKDYDGTPLVADFTLNYSENFNASKYSIEVIGSITDVGTFQPYVKVYDNEGNDCTYLFDIVNTMGTLTVYKSNITITIGDVSVAANQDLSQIMVTATYQSSIVGRLDVSLFGFASSDRYTSVNISSANALAVIYDIDGNNITNNFTIKYVGTILVN